MLSDPFAQSEKLDYHKFENIGDTVTGIVDKIDEVQETEFGTGTPVTWPDGRPKMIYVLEVRDVATGEVKSLWLRGNQIKAVRTAATAEGGLLGKLLKLRYDSDGTPPQKGFRPPKLFKAKIEPAPANAAPRKAVEPSSDPFGGFDDEEPF